jgi:glutathione S-transferase
MSEDIVFYFNPRSRAQMAHWMLEEVGAPYRIVPIDFELKQHKTPEFLAINPMGKLPTITWRGVTVTETAAIIAFLADAFPEAGLAPAPDDPQRGPYYRWLFFGAGCIEPALIDRMFKRPDPPAKGALGYGSYDEMVNALKKALSPGPYLLGNKFTAADVYVGSEIYWAGKIGADRFNDDKIFTDYIARLSKRPAWQQSIAEDAKSFPRDRATTAD